MTVDIIGISRCIREFDFTRLFIEELGWDYLRTSPPIEIDGVAWRLDGIAEKRGFQVFLCTSSDGAIPDRVTRQRIDNQLAKLALEHLIVYIDAAKTAQRWQWALRQPEMPVQYREDRYDRGESGERLAQKLQHLFISIDEDERLTIIDINQRASLAFRKEKVTRKFYDRFAKERKDFLPQIQGIPVEDDRDWYGSIMLNRLMFVYFVQKKGFLNNDHNYLRHKLHEVKARHGQDQFYSFYRHFLLKLFHKGLGSQPPRPPEIQALLGDVPYLNGGIFEQHQIEQANPDIQIPDVAFKRIFDFFDEYDWHLDDRPLRDDTEINPDVLGYIFEKYINQKQMGAYYTKEDITEYISKNTIIPFLFDAAKKDCAIAFRPDGALWGLLRDNPDRYIYPNVHKGAEKPLPPDIAAGICDVSQRGSWNRPADAEYALPTEWWREHVIRRQRYEEIWSKLVDGEVTSIDDLITHNLDIRQFAQDVIQHAEGPELLRAFFKAIQHVSVLDPTCGSGAFLFAALNVLAPLYDACLERMEEFVVALERSGDEHHPQQFSDFRATLAEAGERGRDYYIYKTIILNNLYGVDIMEEAVEICKLRLFLKLASELKPGETPEPLPDIDFNIRTGNTLIGFASLEEVKRAIAVSAHGNNRLPLPEDAEALLRVENAAESVNHFFQQFRQQQTELSGAVTTEGKQALRRQLSELANDLDCYLARQYGIAREDATTPDQMTDLERRFAAWRESHKPLHWYAEFYGIMKRGGFDVIIGNPPYVEYSTVKRDYTVKGYATQSSGNLYALCIERSYALLGSQGRFSFIVQAPVVSTQRMLAVRSLLMKGSDFLLTSSYDDRPSKLFDGMHHARLAIILSRRSRYAHAQQIGVTQYHKWYKEERSTLFPTIQYILMPTESTADVIPKLGSAIEVQLYHKVMCMPYRIGRLISESDYRIFYKITGVGHWFAFTTRPPKFWRGDTESTSTRENSVGFTSSIARDTAFCCLWSTLHYWIYQARTNCRDFNPSDLHFLPIPASVLDGVPKFSDLARRLMNCLAETSEVTAASYTVGGAVRYEKFRPKFAKPIIDEIDRVLAQHYGFTDEELEFIINYDIKYRIGKDGLDGV